MKLRKRQAGPIKNLILVRALDNMPLCFFGGGGAIFVFIMELNPSQVCVSSMFFASITY